MILFGIYIKRWREVQDNIRTVTADAYQDGFDTAVRGVESIKMQAYTQGRADERKQTLAVATKVLTTKE